MTDDSDSRKPKHIMMSYAWEGTQDLVYEVAEQLKNENIPVWMDIRNGLGGKLNDGLANAVENSAAVCFFMTPHYQDSKNCRKELEYADKLEIPLIPCRCCSDYKPSGWLGLISSGLMWFDFRDLSEQPVNVTMNKLINYIQTSILKIQPTVFPDLDGRTVPIIFRNRHQYRAPQGAPEISATVMGYDEGTNLIHREQETSPTVSRASSQLDSKINRNSASLFVDFETSCVGPEDEQSIQRFSDLDNHSGLNKILMPISGYEKLPLLCLEETVISLVPLLGDDIHRYVYIAKQNTREPADGLTNDESASIQLYTTEWSPGSHSLYAHLNRALRAENRRGLIPWFPYLKLFLTALFKLPSQRLCVWRGVKADLSNQYLKGATITWWCISSCTTSVDVLESEQYIGKHGTRTLFSIETFNAKSVKEHSYYQAEEEILLLPGTYLRVMSTLRPGSNLTIIHLKEETPPFAFIEPPFRYVSEQDEAPLRSSRPLQRESQPSQTKSNSKIEKVHQPHQSPQKNKSNPSLKKK